MVCIVLASMVVTDLAWGSSSRWVNIEDLAGVTAHVAIATDPSKQLTLSDLLESKQFSPALDETREPISQPAAWFQIDLTVPPHLLGHSVWLRVVPALIWQADLYSVDGKKQHSGLSLPISQHSEPSFPSHFRIALDQPTARYYLYVSSALPQLTHVSLLSDTALRDEIKRDTLSQGIFIGAAVLMLLLALINWASTRQAIYRDFSVYIASASLFILFFNGYIASYVFSESPFLVGRLSVISFAVAMASTILFSIHVLDIKKHQPQLEKPLRLIIFVILFSMVFVIEFTMIDMMAKILWSAHLVIGLFLLGISFKQAVSERCVQYWLVFAGYLSFTVFEKSPLLSMAGMLPITTWTTDIAKIGLFFQMVLTHFQLLIRLKEQRNLQQEIMKANIEAKHEQAQRRDLIQFLGMFGHEVRTPLAIIDAATQSLEILSGVGSPQIQLRHKRIRSAVARLNLLAKEALSRERIEAGGWHLQSRPVVLKDLIEDILAFHETELPEGNFVGKMSLPITIAGQPGGILELTSHKEMPDFIADPDMLQVALGNLLDNARKYADAASVIHLDIQYNQIQQTNQSTIRFNVLSQGVVLTPAELLLVFDKYWRRDEHRNIGGAGLGLYLVKLIAKSHGGSVEVSNLSNRWTCFSVQIPLRLVAVDYNHDITDEARKSCYRRR